MAPHRNPVQDVSLREQNEVTYNAQKVVIARKKYALNEKGQQLHGNIYDGRGEPRHGRSSSTIASTA